MRPSRSPTRCSTGSGRSWYLRRRTGRSALDEAAVRVFHLTALAAGSTRHRVDSLLVAAQIRVAGGRIRAAFVCYRRALTLAKQAGDRELSGLSLRLCGLAPQPRPAVEAVAAFEEALDLQGDPGGADLRVVPGGGFTTLRTRLGLATPTACRPPQEGGQFARTILELLADMRTVAGLDPQLGSG